MCVACAARANASRAASPPGSAVTRLAREFFAEKDSATDLPPKYKPPSLRSSALQQSTVQLSWDGEDAQRSQALKRDFGKAELREMDYSAYLASDSDDEDDEGGYYEFESEAAPPPRPPRGERTGLAMAAAADDDDDDGAREMSFVPAAQRARAARRQTTVDAYRLETT